MKNDEDQKKLTQQSCVYLGHVALFHIFPDPAPARHRGARTSGRRFGVGTHDESWHEHVIKHEQTDFHGDGHVVTTELGKPQI
jgi:hypothetical protein